ncbi:MAG TPA: nicotinamide-nucleotide amidohydrolase family protein [Propionibacteriaceae bacterium]|nr:nicotinamide-nucleotide amidohydrolase family protein [Propionibacteriaceae bacterium]
MRSALAASILAELKGRGETLASAESLTGGMLGALLTDIPGSSASYLGGVISYATSLKATLAGVDAATLTEFGPVAAPTAAEMARGVAYRCNADWGVAATGVAGPEAQDGHPVGQVFVAVSHQAGELLRVQELSLQGDRAAVRKQAAAAALTLLADALGLDSVEAEVADASLT